MDVEFCFDFLVFPTIPTLICSYSKRALAFTHTFSLPKTVNNTRILAVGQGIFFLFILRNIQEQLWCTITAVFSLLTHFAHRRTRWAREDLITPSVNPARTRKRARFCSRFRSFLPWHWGTLTLSRTRTHTHTSTGREILHEPNRLNSLTFCDTGFFTQTEKCRCLRNVSFSDTFTWKNFSRTRYEA